MSDWGSGDQRFKTHMIHHFFNFSPPFSQKRKGREDILSIQGQDKKGARQDRYRKRKIKCVVDKFHSYDGKMSMTVSEERRRISFFFSVRFKNRSFFGRKSLLPPWLSWLMRRHFSEFSQVKQRWARLVLRWETTETVFWL